MAKTDPHITAQEAAEPAERAAGKVLRIDVDAVLRQRAPGVRRWMPRWLVRRLERLICQDDMNDLLERNHGKRDAEFCRGCLHDLNITVDTCAPYGLPDPSQRRVVIASNHPLGGLDGIAMIDFFTRYYGGHVNFLVNDLLMAVEPLHGVFLPINKHGDQSRDSLRKILDAFAGPDPVIIFPAGLVSRSGKGGRIADLEWKKMFITWSIRAGRPIIPVHFDGHNSPRFYRFAKWRKRLGLKFNAEMVLLPSEVFRSRDKTFTLTIGRPIATDALKDASPEQKAAQIREIVYSLSPQAEQS